MIPSKEVVRLAVEAAAARHGLDPEIVLAKTRKAEIVAARADAIRMVRAHGNGRYTTGGIARAFAMNARTICYWTQPESYRKAMREKKRAAMRDRRTQ